MTEQFTPTDEHMPALIHPRFVEGTPENTETLELFTEGLQDLQSTNPEIVGATLFGSRLKGQSTAESDVDCTILVDANQLGQKGVEISVDGTGAINWGSHEQLKDGYRAFFGQQLAKKTGKAPATIEGGIYVEPVSETLIAAQIEKHLTYLAEYGTYQEAANKWVANINSSNSRPIQPEYVPIAGAIPALFSPDLLPGLDKYRQTVIDNLTEAGPNGEAAWRDILEHIDFKEGHRDIDDPTAYPVNLEQAKQWYGGQNE